MNLVNDELTIRDRLQEVAIFSGLSRDYREEAKQTWKLLEPFIERILNRFYNFIEDNGFKEEVDKATRELLIAKQYDHWKNLFRTEFTDEYINSVPKIGLTHKNINLSASTYVSGYGFLLTNMSDHVSDILKDDPELALKLIRTINSLVLIDMSLALSVYNSEVVFVD